MIELIDVDKSFGKNQVFSGLSLDVTLGATTVVMGESGSGKSVLIKLMNGLMMPDSGKVIVLGQDTSKLSTRELRKMRLTVGTMFQNYALFDSMSVLENIAFPLRQTTDMKDAEIREKCLALLATLGLPDIAELFPSALSGGMKKRVSFARTIVSEPAVVLFDEPTTGLDPVMIEFVDQMLVRTREQSGITSVIISHDMASVFTLGDRMAMLHEGRVTFAGDAKTTRVTPNPEVRRFVDSGTSRLDGERQPEGTYDETFGLKWEDLPAPPTKPIIRFVDLHKKFGDRHILKGINMYALKNEITTIIGGSGSGKSVTMKHALGLFRPTSGEVDVLGMDVNKLSDSDLVGLRLRFGMLFQSAALFDSMSVLDNVMFPLRERPKGKVSARVARDKALSTLERLRIVDLADKSPSDISSGQRKRVGLARAIVTEPDIMIYDEPTTGLDPVMTRYVNDMIVEAQEAFELTTVVVSHDMASSFRISDRIAMLSLGRILAFGTPRQILQTDHPTVQEFIFAGTDESTATGVSPSA